MIEEHGKNEELSCFYFGINHEDEVSQVLILLPIKIKYYLANTPKAMLLDLNFGCGLGSYIRIKRNWLMQNEIGRNCKQNSPLLQRKFPTNAKKLLSAPDPK